MAISRGTLRLLLVAGGTLFLAGVALSADPQPSRQPFKNPCGIDRDEDRTEREARPSETHGLMATDDGVIVYDANQGLCWLADANLAGNPKIRATLNVAGINPDGTSDHTDWGHLRRHHGRRPATICNETRSTVLPHS